MSHPTLPHPLSNRFVGACSFYARLYRPPTDIPPECFAKLGHAATLPWHHHPVHVLFFLVPAAYALFVVVLLI